MRIDYLDAGRFKLDGGAMFGIVPKRLWARHNPPDANNLCTWATRCLLIRTGERVIVVDCGIGDKQDAKFREHFEPHGETTLASELARFGLAATDVTDVLLTHLHFDHVGGATYRDGDGTIRCTFPRAVYWTNDAHWAWAMSPNAKEAASFLTENLEPLAASGQLDRLPVQRGRDLEWLTGVTLRPLYGHTEAMLMPIVTRDDGSRLVYCADLMPSAAHVRLPWVLAYDVRPLDTLAEKDKLLAEAVADDYLLVFEHDASVAEARVEADGRGGFRAVET